MWITRPAGHLVSLDYPPNTQSTSICPYNSWSPLFILVLLVRTLMWARSSFRETVTTFSWPWSQEAGPDIREKFAFDCFHLRMKLFPWVSLAAVHTDVHCLPSHVLWNSNWLMGLEVLGLSTMPLKNTDLAPIGISTMLLCSNSEWPWPGTWIHVTPSVIFHYRRGYLKCLSHGSKGSPKLVHLLNCYCWY